MLAASHSPWGDVVDVYCLLLAYLAGDEVVDVVAHPFKINFGVLFHFSPLS